MFGNSFSCLTVHINNVLTNFQCHCCSLCCIIIKKFYGYLVDTLSSISDKSFSSLLFSQMDSPSFYQRSARTVPGTVSPHAKALSKDVCIHIISYMKCTNPNFQMYSVCDTLKIPHLPPQAVCLFLLQARVLYLRPENFRVLCSVFAVHLYTNSFNIVIFL